MLAVINDFIPLKLEDLARSEKCRITLEQFLAHFKFEAYTDGSVRAVHTSGSYVSFDTEGDVRVHARKSLHLEPERYLFHGPAGDEAAVDALNMERAAQGVPQVLEAIAHGNLQHLRAKAIARGISLPC